MKKPALRICGTNSAAEYAEAMKQIEEHKYPTPQEELVKAMGKAIEKAQKELLKGQKDLLDNMTESLEEGSVKTRGAKVRKEIPGGFRLRTASTRQVAPLRLGVKSPSGPSR